MTRRLLELALVGVVACGAPAVVRAPAAPPPPPPPAPVVHVTVTHVAPDRFHVEYTLPEPSARLDLQRHGAEVRAHWVPVDAQLVHDGDRESLIAPAPRTRFEIDLTADTFDPEKDYRNHFSFTDGGRLLYTGHLAATTLRGTITLVGAPGESVIVHGQPPGPTATAPMQSDGTYVYFGTAKPITTDDVVSVIDPGMPPSTRADLDSLLPRLFKLYGDGLGRPPSAAEKPLLFASYAKIRGNAWSINGGVMPPRVVSLGLEYAGEPVPPAVRFELEYVIAHESAHLWNGDLYSSDSSWIPGRHRRRAGVSRAVDAW